jgi:hypothetical protein
MYSTSSLERKLPVHCGIQIFKATILLLDGLWHNTFTKVVAWFVTVCITVSVLQIET